MTFFSNLNLIDIQPYLKGIEFGYTFSQGDNTQNCQNVFFINNTIDIAEKALQHLNITFSKIFFQMLI